MLMRRPEPVDWFRLLADLQGFGWSNATVARAMGVAPSTLARWKEGSEPHYEDGKALVLLHWQICLRPTEIRMGESSRPR